MPLLKRLIFVGLALACGVPATGHAASAAAPATRPTAVGPVISRLVMRRQTIVIRGGEAGPTYSLETRGGDVLAPPMTAVELAVRNPDLLNTVRTMQTAVLWAGE